MRKTLEQRFWEKVDRRDTNECWQWKATWRENGYGVFYDVGNHKRSAHRVAYELAVGPIPDGKQIDHQCHNEDSTCQGGRTCQHRRCVNPAHLMPATNKENLNRGRNHYALKSHCPQGHPYSGDNLLINSTNGGRQCRICVKASQHRKYVERARAEGVKPRPTACPKCGGPYEEFKSGVLKGRHFCRPCTNARKSVWEKARRAARAR